MQRALDLLDDEVERSLYKRAIGYRAEIEEVMWNPKLGKHIITKLREYFPPDAAAACVLFRKSGRDEALNDEVTRALDLLDDEVERSLNKRAVGYRAEVEKLVWNPKLGKHIIMKVRKYFPPDAGAARFLLTNRAPPVVGRAFTFNIFERNLAPKNWVPERITFHVPPTRLRDGRRRMPLLE